MKQVLFTFAVISLFLFGSCKGNFKTVANYAGRRIMWITPCKRSAARGLQDAPGTPELRSSSTRYGVGDVEDCHNPELRLRLARGYPYLRPPVLLGKNNYAKGIRLNRILIC